MTDLVDGTKLEGPAAEHYQEQLKNLWSQENERRPTLMCNRCTYVYRAPREPGYYDVGEPDRFCKDLPYMHPSSGTLIEAPPDARPGTYYDPNKDTGIHCKPWAPARP